MNLAGRPAAPLYTYELKLPEFNLADESQIDAVLGQIEGALRTPHVRLISYVMPLPPARFEAARRQKAQPVSDFGRLYLEEEVRTLNAKLDLYPAWEMRHFLLSWGQAIHALPQWFQAEASPPEVLPGRYREEADYLRPLNPGDKFVKLVGTYEFRPNAVWNWWHPFGQLIAGADGPMLVCLDAKRLSPLAVRLARRGFKAQMQAARGEDDDLETLWQAAQAALQRNDDFYQMRLLVMLRDTQLPRLRERAERLRQQYEPTLAFSLLPGAQAAALRFFTELEEPAMPVNAHHLVTGAALPVAFGGLAGMGSRVKVDGIYLGFRIGLGGQNLGPSYFQGWTRQQQAYHVGILGATGSGKTVFVMAALAREFALNDTAIAFIDPMGNCARLANLLDRDPRVALHRLSWKSIRLNPMDYVGESEPEQIDHLHALMQTLLDRPLDNIELTQIAQAARRLYQGGQWATDESERWRREVPRLEDFCQALRDLHSPEADYLARELDGLYVSSGYGEIFNAHTNLDLDFEGATLYDVEEVAGPESGQDRFKTILYYTLLASLIRVARRSRQAGTGRRRILALDEFYYLSRNPYLSARMVELIKTARNRGLGVWFCEQNLATFCGLKLAEGPVDLSRGAGHLMMTNVPIWFVFRQGDRETALVRQEFASRCPPALSEFLPTAQVGQGLALLSAMPLQSQILEMDLLPSERLALTLPAGLARPEATTVFAAGYSET